MEAVMAQPIVFGIYKKPRTQQPEKKEDHPVHLIVKAWKLHKDLPTDGDDSKIWNRNHFKEHACVAKKLFDEFGFEGAVECIEYVSSYMLKNKLSYTIHTINKRSDLYREFLAKRGR